jgi:hypothetical protein
VYVVVWVGDDPAECDGRSDIDGGACAGGENPGANVVALLVHAYGAAGVLQEIEVTAGRPDPASRPRLLSWRQRQ